jgi:hypothetical protein
VRALAAIGTMYMFIQFKENAEREFRGGKVNPSGRLSVRRTPCLQYECTFELNAATTR